MSRSRVPQRAWQGLMQASPEEGVQPLKDAKLIDITLIHTDPSQPRKHFDEEAMAELTASVRERGILQPITVQKRDEGGYFVVTGERRLRAARDAGLDAMPALVVNLSETMLRLDRVIENRQRKDLTDLEFARAMTEIRGDLGDQAPNLTSNDLDEFVGQRLGLSGRTVRNFMAMLNLDPAIEQLLGGDLTEVRTRSLTRVGYDPAVQIALAQAIQTQDLSGRQALAVAELLKEQRGLSVARAVGQVLGRAEAARPKTGERKGRRAGSAEPQAQEITAHEEEAIELYAAENGSMLFAGDDPQRRIGILMSYLRWADAVLAEPGADTEVPLNRQQVRDLDGLLEPLVRLRGQLRAAMESIEEKERLGDLGYEGEPLPHHLAVMLPFGSAPAALPTEESAVVEPGAESPRLRPVTKSRR